MSNTNFSTNMGYSRTVSSGSSSGGLSGISPSSGSWNFDTDLENYKRTNTATQTESLMEDDGSMNLNMFIDADGGDTYQTGTVTGSLGLELANLDDESWITDLVEGLKVVGATVVNGVVGFGEGLVDFGEGLYDAGCVIAGVTMTPFTIMADGVALLNSLITGEKYESVTGAYWSDVVLAEVNRDYSDEWFSKIYENEFMQGVNDYAVDSMKRGGAGYGVCKEIGYLTGTILLGVGTAGVGSAVGVGGFTASQVSTVATGLAKAGNTMDKKYSDLLKRDGDISGLDSLSIVVNGTATGAIESFMWYITFGNGIDKIAANLTKAFQSNLVARSQILRSLSGLKEPVFSANFVNGVNTLLSKSKVLTFCSNVFKKVFPNTLKRESILKAFFQFVKPSALVSVDYGTTGLDVSQDKTIIDYYEEAINKGIDNAMVAIVYDASFLKKVVEKLGAKTASKLGGKSDYNYKGHEVYNESSESYYEEVTEQVSKLYKDLADAISNYDYRGNFEIHAHLTRMIFEGLKKTGGTVVKKGVPVFIKDIGNKFEKLLTTVFGT